MTSSGGAGLVEQLKVIVDPMGCGPSGGMVVMVTE